MIKPLNTEWNRKTKLLDSTVEVLILKNGLVYFKTEREGQMLFLKCAENLFTKNFAMHGFAFPEQLPENSKIDLKVFIDYPTKIL